jgi:hypothetical protein
MQLLMASGQRSENPVELTCTFLQFPSTGMRVLMIACAPSTGERDAFERVEE